MKKALFIVICGLMASAFIFIQTGCKGLLTPEEIKASIEITDVESKWVEKLFQPWPPRLILVPAISFRIKNICNKPLRYMYFNAIFKFRNERDNLGDSLVPAFQNKALLPGEVSDPILMKSNFGVEGKLLSDFKNNPSWKIAMVKLFVKLKGSQYVLLGEWEVSQKIDFKEPEPVGMKKQEEKSSL